MMISFVFSAGIRLASYTCQGSQMWRTGSNVPNALKLATVLEFLNISIEEGIGGEGGRRWNLRGNPFMFRN